MHLRLTLSGGMVLFLAATLVLLSDHAGAQAALLMEKPFGIASYLDPTGHEAIYFARICADTPTHLRRCHPGELGSVIARYHGIAQYDWLAIPLIPYLYAVDEAQQVPAHVDRAAVLQLRRKYHDAHLAGLGSQVPMGGALHRGWNQLVGVAFDREIYAFRFPTTEAQDDALIASLNDHPNRSHFNLEYNNCADFAAHILNNYFPGTFHRRLLPDAGMTTPRQNAYQLVRYARRHPETSLSVFRIPVVAGGRRSGPANESIAESLVAAGYAIPLAVVSPYAAAGVLVDSLVWGRYPIRLKGAHELGPEDVANLDSVASGKNSRAAADASTEAGLF